MPIDGEGGKWRRSGGEMIRRRGDRIMPHHPFLDLRVAAGVNVSVTCLWLSIFATHSVPTHSLSRKYRLLVLVSQRPHSRFLYSHLAMSSTLQQSLSELQSLLDSEKSDELSTKLAKTKVSAQALHVCIKLTNRLSLRNLVSTSPHHQQTQTTSQRRASLAPYAPGSG